MARRNTAVTNNWTSEATLTKYKKEANKALNKIKKSRKGKKFEYMAHPSGIGMIEIEIKDE